jgi:hypothetical protein
MSHVLRGAAVGALTLMLTAALLLVSFLLLVGPSRVFVGAGLEFNTTWIGVAMVASLFAASLAGWVAHRSSGALAAVYLLAALVLCFGLADAALHHWLMPQLGLIREGLAWPAMLVGLREPLWYDLAGPVLMAIFIWVAGSSRHIESTEQIPRKRHLA